MFRRRRRDDDATPPPAEATPDDAVRADDAVRVDGADGDADAVVDAADEAVSPKSERPDGPYDATEVDLVEARRTRIDLGGLLVKGIEGMQLQLQVDKRSGKATSALLGLTDAAVQLVAVAAPRSSGLWGQTRLQIAADARRRGGSAEEASGPFGPEVRVIVPVTTPDGKQGMQPSRVSAIDGPRWMLRATFLGKSTTDAAVFQRLAAVVRDTVVIRGEHPMAPGEVIALRPPPGAQAQQPAPEQPAPGQS